MSVQSSLVHVANCSNCGSPSHKTMVHHRKWEKRVKQKLIIRHPSQPPSAEKVAASRAGDPDARRQRLFLWRRIGVSTYADVLRSICWS